MTCAASPGRARAHLRARSRRAAPASSSRPAGIVDRAAARRRRVARRVDRRPRAARRPRASRRPARPSASSSHTRQRPVNTLSWMRTLARAVDPDADLAFAQHLVRDRRAPRAGMPARSSRGPCGRVAGIPALELRAGTPRARRARRRSARASARSGTTRHPERVHVARHREVLQRLVVAGCEPGPTMRTGIGKSFMTFLRSMRRQASQPRAAVAGGLDRRCRPSAAASARASSSRATSLEVFVPVAQAVDGADVLRRRAAPRAPASAGSRSAARAARAASGSSTPTRKRPGNARTISGTITARSSVSLKRTGSSVKQQQRVARRAA